MTIKHNQAELVRSLRDAGLYFKEFKLAGEGEYTVDDADWNYKDVPHLKHIHKLVDAYPSWIADDVIASINIQKLFGFKVPLTLFNYESGKDRQTYHTSFLFFALIIETSYERLAELRTRVTTSYAVGGNKWLVKLLFPLMKFSLTRNYRALMNDDIPMRTRRGQIRKWGYQILKRKPTYGFIDTMKVNEQNVIAPTTRPLWGPVEIPYAKLEEGVYVKVGESDHLGLQVKRKGQTIEFFPRLCPHEGACLDANETAGAKEIICPWHARKFGPLVSLTLRQSGKIETESHVIEAGEESLKISCKH